MPFFLKTLVLGVPETIHFYLSRAFGEPGDDKETYFEWYKEVRVLEDICDLEIDAIVSLSADLDEIIPIVDGIIYFLNPLNEEETELFKMVLPDIFSVKRDIPTIVIYYDQNGILPISVNELLTDIWVNFPSLEAFVNLHPHEFHQALQSLCLAMIRGDTPLNIENAFMRFPIFIQMANIYYEKKNYFYAAQAVRKAAQIAEIYNKEEFYIIADQAAFLYSKINLYLEASNILEDIDRKKSKNFKNLYVDAMLGEANRFFNKKEYETAATQYERAGQWASIESLDSTIIIEAFKLAINSWITACKVENAFKILENMPHGEVLSVMKDISEKISIAADLLVDDKRYELARGQLKTAIYKYQREALSEELKDLTNKLADILIQILKHQIDAKEIYAAKYTYDEIENVWESYKVEKIDLDSILKILINSFLEKNNFTMATTIINELNSLKLKQDLTKISGEFEEKYKASVKKELEDNVKKGVEILSEFVEREFDIIVEINKKKIREADEYAKHKNYYKAAVHLDTQVDYLKKIGKESIANQILTKSLDFLLEGDLFEEFFISFNSLLGELKRKYLLRIYPMFLQRLKKTEKMTDIESIIRILEDSGKIYRNLLLYDEAKEISMVFINMIKIEIMRILQNERSIAGIRKVNELLKKADTLSSAYLEKEERIKISFDEIFKEVAGIYIELDDLTNAQSYNDMIQNKAYKKEIHEKIDKLELEKSKVRTDKAKETYEGEVLDETRSIIETKAGEYQRLDQKKEFRERRARKTRDFEEALTHITNQEYDEAITAYKKSISKLNRIQKYSLAGTSLAMVVLLLFRENQIRKVDELLEETLQNISTYETFPIALVKYILQSKKLQNESKFNESLSFMNYLPLFKEELKFLREQINKDLEEENELEKFEEKDIEVKRLKRKLSQKQIIELDQRYGKIQSKVGEIRREREDFLNRRKGGKRMFYNKIFLLIESQKFREAATEYYNSAKTIISKRRDLKTGSLLILLQGLCLIKIKESYSLIRKNIDQFLINLGIRKKSTEDTYYIMLIQFILDVYDYNLDNYLPKIKGMVEVLPLFEEEKVLIES
ncbi:MAG: hypothetical protein ACW99L_10155 [Promethearchaeota archaeon]|jgi:hypothetical protein